MKPNNEELERRLDRFKIGLRNAGVKLTHQRIEIFREVAKSGDHPDVETVFEGVRRRLPTISLDTVYRTIWLLIDVGLLNTLGPQRDRMRFDANDKPHHHFVCIECGATQDFYCEQLDQIQLPEEVNSMGTVEMKQLEVRGVCSRCKKTAKAKQCARRKKGDT